MKLSFAFTISLLLGLTLTSRASPNVKSLLKTCIGEECTKLFSDKCMDCVNDCIDDWYDDQGISKRVVYKSYELTGGSGLSTSQEKSLIGGPAINSLSQIYLPCVDSWLKYIFSTRVDRKTIAHFKALCLSFIMSSRLA